MVTLETDEKPGTVIVDTNNKFLYLIQNKNKAIRYGIGVGREGFGWSGVVKVQRKAEWPGWTPPKEMIARERKKGHILPAYQEGGIDIEQFLDIQGAALRHSRKHGMREAANFGYRII